MYTRTFLIESNIIERILAPVTELQHEAFRRFLAFDTMTVGRLREFVMYFQADAVLRDQPGADVFVGDDTPPPGGPGIMADLQIILDSVAVGQKPYLVHHAYETLHPFTDCNGRSGRALWAWQMWRQGHDLCDGFLRTFYMQTLRHGVRRG